MNEPRGIHLAENMMNTDGECSESHRESRNDQGVLPMSKEILREIIEKVDQMIKLCSRRDAG
ncbi:MAG: hypothetical protein V1792_15005 [Pseudomonadota bacterium]